MIGFFDSRVQAAVAEAASFLPITPSPNLPSRSFYFTQELMATKKLTVSVMNAIKTLAKVNEANQIGRVLPPEAFYNQLISEKMDVQDHYTAWRQTQV